MTRDRRAFITHVAGLGAAWAIADWAAVDDALAYAAQAATAQPRPAFQNLTAAEAKVLEAMAARILPTTDTPGAREAGVIYFMDKAFGSFEKEALADIRKGLPELARRSARRKRGATFDTLPATDQDAIIKELEKEDLVRATIFLTMVGTFGNPSYGGNRDRIGWKLVGFDPQPVHKPPFGYYDAEVMRGPAR